MEKQAFVLLYTNANAVVLLFGSSDWWLGFAVLLNVKTTYVFVALISSLSIHRPLCAPAIEGVCQVVTICYLFAP